MERPSQFAERVESNSCAVNFKSCHLQTAERAKLGQPLNAYLL